MARVNYTFEKRQRELAKKKKKEEKRQQKDEARRSTTDNSALNPEASDHSDG